MWFTSAFATTFDQEPREIDRSGVAGEHSVVRLFNNSQKAVNKGFAKPVERFVNYDEKSDECAFKSAMKSEPNRRSHKG